MENTVVFEELAQDSLSTRTSENKRKLEKISSDQATEDSIGSSASGNEEQRGSSDVPNYSHNQLVNAWLDFISGASIFNECHDYWYEM
ncbi:hypothetical protein DFQ28_008730 [Apophysomyces sp. BC1034]|nr:hypothetical protein DFQ29_006648 [Apophysomyces sp. BC1021]KAG0185820.1 hypothetical protein DFQ28_008730 [Apophysomyces sp. BC1034]